MQNKGGNEKFSYIMRTVAGAYLCYLSYSILKSVVNGETGNRSILITICAVIFIILGVILIIAGLRGMKQLSNQQTDDDETAEAEQEPEVEMGTVEALEDQKEENSEEDGASH